MATPYRSPFFFTERTPVGHGTTTGPARNTRCGLRPPICPVMAGVGVRQGSGRAGSPVRRCGPRTLTFATPFFPRGGKMRDDKQKLPSKMGAQGPEGAGSSATSPRSSTCLASVHSVQFSRSVGSDSLRPHGLQHTRPPCPSLTPGACSNSCPLSW